MTKKYNANIKELKGLVGSYITPTTSLDGRFGYAVEQAYNDAGFDLNPGEGPDLPDYGQEIKTKQSQSYAEITIGNYSKDKFVNSEGTIACDKLKNWLFHKIDAKNERVLSATRLDWENIPSIQDEFLNDLKKAALCVSNVNLKTVEKTRIYSGKIFTVEKCNGAATRVKLRMKNSVFKKLMTRTLVNKSFNNLFVEVSP